jgi:hypothetical protein
LATDIQDVTGGSVGLALVDQGYKGEIATKTVSNERIRLHVVKLPEAQRGFVLLPRRRGVRGSLPCATCCRRLIKAHERYATTLAGYHVVAFVEDVLEHTAMMIHNA